MIIMRKANIKNLSKNFPSGSSQVKALNNITLSIKEGQFIAIVGPSGSGKSTLLNLIGGLDTPTEGEIFVNNKNLSELKDKELSRKLKKKQYQMEVNA